VILDLVLENARIVTLDPDHPRATRLGIWAGRIVGVDAQIEGLPARETRDLGGCAVLPGFIDAHTHLQLTGQAMLALDIGSATTVAQALDLIGAGCRSRGPDEWIEVCGYDQRRIGRDLTAAELAEAAAGRRVWVRHVSSHSSVVSTAVLAAAGDLSTLPEHVREGLLLETEQELVHRQRLPYRSADAGHTVRVAAQAAQRQGVTFCMDAGAGGAIGSLNPLDVATYLDLLAHRPLPVRMQLMPSWDALSEREAGRGDGFSRALDLGIRTGFGSDLLSIGALKMVLDGGMMVRTARFTQPYAGTDERGAWREDPQRMVAALVDAHVAGWQLAVHAIGDEAVDLAIEAFRAGASAAPGRWKHRIEHGGVIRDDQLSALADLGITVVSQPSFLWDSGDDFAALVGPQRTGGLYRGRSLLAAGVGLVGSTDRPLPGSPLRIVQTLVCRRSDSGALLADGEQLSVPQAFATITTSAAEVAGMADRLGRIRSGFLADLTVLAQDPFTVEPDLIAGIDVRATVVDGRLEEIA